jgi:hypothetical protein
MRQRVGSAAIEDRCPMIIGAEIPDAAAAIRRAKSYTSRAGRRAHPISDPGPIGGSDRNHLNLRLDF